MQERTNGRLARPTSAMNVMDWIALVDIAILILAAAAFARGALPL